MSYSEVPSDESIRNELDRILASPAFVRARRSSQLLRFLVETKLGGGDPRLKEYSIATDYSRQSQC